ncbi:MAG: hypothetical protein ACOH1J_08135 [Microbacteriaceae bacterium]
MEKATVSFEIPEEFRADVEAHVAEFGLSASELAREAFIAYILGSRAGRQADADEHSGVSHLPASSEAAAPLNGDESWLGTEPGSDSRL